MQLKMRLGSDPSGPKFFVRESRAGFDFVKRAWTRKGNNGNPNLDSELYLADRGSLFGRLGREAADDLPSCPGVREGVTMCVWWSDRSGHTYILCLDPVV